MSDKNPTDKTNIKGGSSGVGALFGKKPVGGAASKGDQPTKTARAPRRKQIELLQEAREKSIHSSDVYEDDRTRKDRQDKRKLEEIATSETSPTTKGSDPKRQQPDPVQDYREADHDGTTLFTNLPTAPAATAAPTTAGDSSSPCLPATEEPKLPQQQEQEPAGEQAQLRTTAYLATGVDPERQDNRVDPTVAADRQAESQAVATVTAALPPSHSGSPDSEAAGGIAEGAQTSSGEQSQSDSHDLLFEEVRHKYYHLHYDISEGVKHGGSTGVPTGTALEGTGSGWRDVKQEGKGTRARRM